MKTLTTKSLLTAAVLMLAAGCAGPTGETGAKGADGADGVEGERGVRGDRGDKGADGAVSLTNLEIEDPGEHCSYGGHRIDSGVDTNFSGALDPDEIVYTRYLCNEAPAARVLNGPVFVHDDAELAELNTYEGVIGDVFVTFNPKGDGFAGTSEAASVELNVGFVTGALSIDVAEKTTSVILPNLKSASQLYIAGANIDTIDASELASALGVELIGTPRLQNLDLSSLTTSVEVTIQDTSIVHLSLPVLKTLRDELDISENPKLQTIDLSSVEVIGWFYVADNDALESIDVEALVAIPESLYVSRNKKLEDFDISNLVRWAHIHIASNESLSTCALARFAANAFKDIDEADFANNLDDMDDCVIAPECVRLKDADGDTPWVACPTPMHYSGATAACVADGGTLATFASADEYARFVAAYNAEPRMQSSLWLGYDASGEGGAYVWADAVEGVPGWDAPVGVFWEEEPTLGRPAVFLDDGTPFARTAHNTNENRFACSVSAD